MSSPPTVLVTGATGFIASHLINTLADLGVRVLATGRPFANVSRLSGVMSRIRYESADLCDPSARSRLFELDRIVTVYHLAVGGIRTDAQMASDMLAMNVVATVELARMSHACGVKQFVYVGSGFEYEPANQPINEAARLEPQNFYGATKGAASLILNEMLREVGLPLISFRPFSVYGPGEDRARFIPYVVDQALKNQPIKLTDCTQVRDYLFVGDVVAALLKAVNGKATVGECYNLGAGVEHAVPIRRVVESVLQLTGASPSLARFGAIERARPEPSYFVADTTKARLALGWRPQVPLVEGLAHTVEWYRQQAGLD